MPWYGQLLKSMAGESVTKVTNVRVGSVHNVRTAQLLLGLRKVSVF
jgi:hypothetical protein